MKIFSTFITFMLLFSSSLWGEAQVISDMGAAMDFCRRRMLDRVEGIWEFPEDNTVVLISSANEKRREYDITVVSTPDCRLNPGEKIGRLYSSVDNDKFRLSLFTSRTRGVLSDPGECMATLNDNDGTIFIEKRKYKISSRINRLLPKFWQILSLFSTSSPLEKLPRGLLRIYPYPAPRNPIYL